MLLFRSSICFRALGLHPSGSEWAPSARLAVAPFCLSLRELPTRAGQEGARCGGCSRGVLVQEVPVSHQFFCMPACPLDSLTFSLKGCICHIPNGMCRHIQEVHALAFFHVWGGPLPRRNAAVAEAVAVQPRGRLQSESVYSACDEGKRSGGQRPTSPSLLPCTLCLVK